MGKSCSPLALATPAAGTLLRHDMKPDRTGWTVHDVLAGWVCLGGLSLVGLSFEDANELVDMLNWQTAKSIALHASLSPLQLTACRRRSGPSGRCEKLAIAAAVCD